MGGPYPREMLHLTNYFNIPMHRPLREEGTMRRRFHFSKGVNHVLAVEGSTLPLNRVPDVDRISRDEGKTGSHRTKRLVRSASARNPRQVRKLGKVVRARDELAIIHLMRLRLVALNPFKTV